MNFNLSPEQQMLQDSVVSFARKTIERFNAADRQYLDQQTWNDIAELGWLAASFPEACGGLGGSVVETLLIHEGIGRGLICEPLLSTTLAARTLEFAAVDHWRDKLLPAALSGETRLILAHEESQARGDLAQVSTCAKRTASGFTLTGVKSLVRDAAAADQFIISARLEKDGIALFRVDAGKLAKHIRHCNTIDSATAAEITLDNFTVDDENLLTSTDASGAVARAYQYAILAACAEAVGAMDAAIEITTDYLNTRKQFNVTIGSFQALQHKLADMAVSVEQARSILLYGAGGLSTETEADHSQAGAIVSGTLARVIDSARLVAGHAVQLHGGIGVTEEHIISHYFRKLTTLANRFGSRDYHLSRYAASL